MNKKEKMKKIREARDTHERFENAENHGRNGGNWWNPTAYVIAYNVKMRSGGSIEELRNYMTELQNERYSDDALHHIIWEELEREREYAKEYLKDEYDLPAEFAGRSGGWLEVDYSAHDLERVVWIDHLENVEDEELDEVYQAAEELQELENEVRAWIEKSHRSYNKYVGSEDYYQDITEGMLQDEDIKKEYKRRAADLLEKAGE